MIPRKLIDSTSISAPAAIRRSATRFAFVTATCLLCGCTAGNRAPEPTRPPPVELKGSRWALVALGGASPESEKPVTLELSAEGKVTGFAGVNRYFGSYELKPMNPARGSIRFDEMGATRMAGPEPLMKLETEFLAALRASDGYTAEGGLLELSSGGAPALRFRQLAAAP